MLQNLKLDLSLAEEFLLLRKDMIPKEERQEELKIALRAFGPGDYPVPTIGLVKISNPGIARTTGSKLVVDETKIAENDPGFIAAALTNGFLRWEPVVTRATASKVEARFDV